MASRRKFTKEFKLAAVGRLRAGESVGLLARSLEVNREDLYRWSRDVEEFGVRAFPGVGQKRMEETRIAELERKIGQGSAAAQATLLVGRPSPPTHGQLWPGDPVAYRGEIPRLPRREE
jgi:transposase-like protein